MRSSRRMVRSLVASFVVLAAGVRAPAALELAVVVGTDSPIEAVDLDELRDLYLRRQRLWPGGMSAVPVNLPADDPLRRSFSRRILGRAPSELVGYWNRRYFEGIRPPLVLQSGRAVCAYLATEPGAVGYVPTDVVDRESCRVVRVIGE